VLSQALAGTEPQSRAAAAKPEKSANFASQKRVDVPLFSGCLELSPSGVTKNVLSDAELVERARRGDTESYGSLCRRYERSALAVALTRLGDVHAAEDVVQATLLVGFQRLATLSDASKFGPWILQIARRQALESTRRRHMSVAIPGGRTSEITTSEASTTDWIDKDNLLRLVERLPDHERVLIGLRFFDGLSLAEIAETTARPLGTVSKQLSRATTRLRGWLRKEETR
jgi:RNA polymerase sigma-70 factor (ECF subfamily)